MAWKYADELEQEYRNDLKGVKRRLGELKFRRDYLLKYKKRCEEQGKWNEIPAIREELIELKHPISVLGGVVSSSMYSIEWLRDAKEPGARREISRRSNYQRTAYWNDMDRQVFNDFRGSYDSLTEEDLKQLDDFTSNLSEREKDAVISVIGKKNSYQEAADFMGVSKGSVQNYVKRGMNKINSNLVVGVQTELF